MLASTNPSFAEWTRSNPAGVVAPGVAVIQGASPRALAGSVQHRFPAVSAPSAGAVTGLALLAAALVSLIGAGWTVTLLSRWLDAPAVAALAPAIGTGILVLGAIPFGCVGLRPNVPGSIAIVSVLTVAGLVAPILRWKASVRGEPSG